MKLRRQYETQSQTIEDLRKKTQQQQGEISVVRANWNRVQQQNVGLQHQQSQMEQEHRKKLEAIQQENRRQLERLETAAAFRVCMKND